MVTVLDRFMAKVRKGEGPDARWEWLASKNSFGYGRMRFDGRSHILVHRGSGQNAGRFYYDGHGTSRYDIEAIAHSLSQLCRFTGNTTRFYSVAEHSCHVADLLEPDLGIQGLLHDAHEFAVGDMNSPLKELCPDYRQIEKRAEREVRRKFGIPDGLHPDVKAADLVMLATEKRDLMDPDNRDTWVILDGVEPLPWSLNCWYRRPWSPTRAKKEFLTRFNEWRGV